MLLAKEIKNGFILIDVEKISAVCWISVGKNKWFYVD